MINDPATLRIQVEPRLARRVDHSHTKDYLILMNKEDDFARSVRDLEAAARDLSMALKDLSLSLSKLKVQADSLYRSHGSPFGEDDRALSVWLEHESWVTPN